MQTATIKKDTKTVLVTIGAQNMKVGTKEVALDVPEQIINNRTMIPVRTIAEAYNGDVKWYSEKYIVDIVTD